MKMNEEQEDYDDQSMIEGKEVQSERGASIREEALSPEDEDKFRGLTVEGKWDEVIGMCEGDSTFCTAMIKASRGTALHVAVNEGNVAVVKRLVAAIIGHGSESESEKKASFESKNERGDSPLHLAAMRGFKSICECIIGENGERRDLIAIDNNEGETPLFYAALSWQKQTFVYLCSFMPASEVNYYKDLIRKNGDSILHCAIRREFFDLALIIMHRYPKLYDIQNREGFSPLKLLATRPSAFKSGSSLIWWKRILYNCVCVETLNVEEAVELYMKADDVQDQNEQFPKNYDTCYQLIKIISKSLRLVFGCKRKKEEDPEKYQISTAEDLGHEHVPPNCVPCLQFVKLAYIYTLGVSGVDIRKMKQKHTWSGQLLSEFMKKPYESYMGSGGSPPLDARSIQPDFISVYKRENDDKVETEALNIEREEAVILVAARNGIVEMVNEFITKIPSAIHETNSKKKNVLLVAVENRQTLVVEALKTRFGEKETKFVLNNLILGVDDQENTVLHLAAAPTNKGWMISGSALRMMWHIKWFQYIKNLVPDHFPIRTNKKEKTAREVFTESHKELAKEAGDWLKNTSESCSVVAALLAGVSFATSTTVPGGVDTDTGKPALEGKVAFESFAMCSLIGLCFSVTALIMFLSILTSRKEIRDFRTNLPVKALLGLSSLFVSITALFATFCSGHFFVIDDKFKQILILLYAVTCLPVTFYAVAQFPLYLDFMRAITTKVPLATNKEDDL